MKVLVTGGAGYVGSIVAEDHPKVPLNAYGESKFLFEGILGWYGRAYGLKHIKVFQCRRSQPAPWRRPPSGDSPDSQCA